MDDIQSWWEVPSIAHFCSLFRVAFNLLDFDIEELEEALLTDGAEDSGSSLLQELIVRLLCGCLGNNGISTFNYQMFLRRLFRQKCREYGRDNPFNTDIDFQFLPLRTKVEILHALCDFRLDAEDVLEVLKNLDSDSLRVHPLGYDENHSAYWYFYGTRLYREDYPKAKKKKKKIREHEKQHGRKITRDSSGGESEPEMGCGEWQVVCYTESDWERLSLKMEDSHCKEERALHTVLAEDFLPEIPRLFEEKEILQRKRLLELQPRRQSSRLEKLKHQKETEKRQAQEEKKVKEEDKDKTKEREGRAKQARERRALLRLRSHSNSTCDSSVEGSSSVVENAENSQPRGRQTNNSLSSATGQIIIQPSRQKLRTSQVFRQSEEDLQTGLYKILDRLKNHDDAWPFVDPVEEEYAPRYYSVIAKPMDLQRMEDKLDSGEYLTFQEFKADFQLIVDNCRQYNGSDNEYTEMAGKLQEAFDAAVDRYLETEISTDEEVAVEFPGEQKGRRRKLSQVARETPPESSNRSVESEVEDGPKEDESDETNSQRAESQNSDRRESRRNINKKTEVVKHPKKAGVIKNVADIEALELATEQTLKDINKWLDDTPRFSEFSSASNSPSQLPLAEEVDGVAARIENEYRARLKLERPIRPKDKMDLTRRRFFKDQGILKRRREIQRTIDRLQPGKSKGNLISNMGTGKGGDENSATGSALGSKTKDQRTTAIVKSEESTPKLSLGTVLANDVLGLGQHTFNQNSDKKELDTADDSSEENLVSCVDSDEKKSVDIEDKLNLDIDDPPVKKARVDKLTNSDEEKKSSPAENVSKLEKSTPNLSAWFKAFGAPKSQPVIKKKNDSDDVKNSPKTIEVVKTNTKEDELIEEDKEKKISVMPPLQSPARRQRKASTGSSVSERSSFSQDPTDPLADGSSPRPSLDEPYLSPQPDPTKTPYHHSPINGTLRVGFYQDTSFARGSSDKSSSPRELPNCSPREPLSCSPKEPSSSPRDLPNCSPREPISSPKTDYPMYTTTSIPRYQSSVVTTSPIYESPLSPYPAHMSYYDTSKPLTDQYRTAPTTNLDKPVPSVFPVKKRVYSEIESPQIVKSNSDTFRGGGSFTPTRGAMEQDRGFTPTPGRIPTQPVSRVPDPSRHTFPQDTALAIGLAHHTMSHHLMDPFAEERLLSSSYFGSESIYGKNTPSTTTISHPIFSQSSSVMTTASYNREEQESAVSYSSRPDLTDSTSYTHVTASSLTYPDSRTKICDNSSSGYVNPAIPLAVKTKSTPVINYSNRNAELLSPCSNRSSTSPINFSSSELNSGKVNSPPLNYLSRQEMISNKPTTSPIGYPKLPSSDLLSGKIRPPSPISFATNRSMDILPPKINTPYRQMSELPPPINYNHTASDLTGKMPVPSPLSYPQSDILSGKMNYNHPMTDLMQSPARYNYPMSDLIPGKTPVAYNHPMADLIQSKGNAGYTNRSVDLLTSNVNIGGYNRQMSELIPTRDMTYSSMTRPISSNKPVEPVLSKSTKKSTKKKKSSEVPPVSSTSFQQYLGQSSTEAIALKSTSVVPGSAFNFGPPPLKDSYASYLEDMRSSGYYVPHPEPSGGTKSSSPGPHAPASPFPFLGHASQRGPTYPHPFMNASYQQYLQRHPEELLRPMVLHQGLLPPTGYPPGYLGMHDAINRSSWL